MKGVPVIPKEKLSKIVIELQKKIYVDGIHDACSFCGMNIEKKEIESLVRKRFYGRQL